MNEPRRIDLAEACRRGDEDAFEELYRTHADGVYHVVTRVLRNHEDATDALQETFLVAFRRFSTYRGEGSLHGWLCQIAVRIALRIKGRRRPQQSAEEEIVPDVPVTDEPPAEHDFHAAVEQEIQRLPEKARLVFVLHTSEGMTHAEIARVMNINEGTSKSQLSYARSLLKKRLSRWHDELS